MASVDRRQLLAIFIGGACGAVARTELANLFPSSPASWPWAMFGVNIVGAFLLGYFVTRLQDRLPISVYRRPFVGTGFCGAFTTFSTMQVELLHMIIARAYPLALGYAAASIICGYLALYVATVTVRRVRVVV